MSCNETHNAKHLTPEQFGELVDGGDAGADRGARAHLTDCAECREELDSMREALALFRESACAFAEREFARGHRVETSFVPIHRRFSPGLLWAAAGLLMIAAGLPIEMQRHARQPVDVMHTSTAAPQAHESDEALLEDIDREVSASVPAPMRALADPTGSASGTSSDVQTSTTRKN